MATTIKENHIAVEVNGLTGEIVERPLTPDELTQRDLDLAEANLRKTEQEAKAAARTSALAKLAELGLTAEEIAAL